MTNYAVIKNDRIANIIVGTTGSDNETELIGNFAIGDNYIDGEFSRDLLPIVDLRKSALTVLTQECNRRITKAYGKNNFNDEIALRLRDGQTTEQDTERERLLAKYQDIKTWINDDNRTQIELDEFNPYDDVLWG